MGMLDDLGAWLDSRKRYAARVASDPDALGLLGTRLTEDAKAYDTQQRGLLADSRSVMPEMRDAAAQQSAQQAVDMATNVGGMGAIKAYHGSPHVFDKFDMSKIGTGEGAQAYGHGLYFAENPKVAMEYQHLQPMSDPTDGGLFYARAALAQAKGKLPSALKFLEDRKQQTVAAREFLMDGGASTLAQIEDAAERIKAGEFKPGNLYEANLRWPDPAREAADPLGPQHFLDWDKPLAQQPQAVRDAMNAAGRASGDPWLRGPFDEYGQTGEQAYRTFAGRLSKSDRPAYDAPVNVPAASDVMRQMGLPGIRYLDGGSRGAGTGTANYVLFDDALAEILKRNGKGLLEP